MNYSRGSQFKTVDRPRIFRNRLDLSHEVRMTADMFFLYPVMTDLCVPGDVWKIGHELILRCNPMVCPVMHEINVYRHDFFVPLRLLNKGSEDFEQWYTGGADGRFTMDVPRDPPTLSRAVGSLWDYLGFNPVEGSEAIIKSPVAYPRRAYNLIYNEYYRDQNLIDPVDLEVSLPDTLDLHVRAFEKDYFTSLLPEQQRGEAMALPLSGNLPVVWDDGFISPNTASQVFGWGYGGGSDRIGFGIGRVAPADAATAKASIDGRGKVNLEEAVTFDVSDLRFVVKLQGFLERNARTGARFVEFLKAHFGVHPRDDRLQRPEYIGGSKVPIIMSEVLQTSSSDGTTPQGNLAGHGITAGELVNNFV